MNVPMVDLLDRWLRIPPAPEPPPGHSAVVFRAAPAFFRYRMLGWFLSRVPLLLFATIAELGLLAVPFADGPSRAEPAMLVLGGVGLLAFGIVVASVAVSFFCLRLDYEKRWYVLSDRSLRVREGVWTVREMTVTFANIQNITIEQGPLERWFKIANLKVDTAGGGGAVATHAGGKQPALHNLHTAWFRGVDNAPEIRELMQQRLRGARDSGLGDLDEPAAGKPPPEQAADQLPELVAEARALRRAADRLAGPATR